MRAAAEEVLGIHTFRMEFKMRVELVAMVDRRQEPQLEGLEEHWTISE